MDSTEKRLWTHVSHTTRNQRSFFTANTHITAELNFQHEAYHLFKQYLSEERLLRITLSGF